ncbi:MAG: efflux RND transporter periplasmic adaptor subunit [Candidatus Paceibacterota bacterium]
MKSIIGYVKENKYKSIIFAIIILVIIYFIYKAIFPVVVSSRYVLGTAEKGTIVSSVTGTGQVSALNQIDLKPKNSGTITYVGVKPGDYVRKGKLLFSVDSTDAKKSVRDAEIGLKNAQISLDKLKIQNSKENLTTTENQAYEDAFNDTSSAYLDMPNILHNLDTILSQQNLSASSARISGSTALSYREKADASLYKAEFELNKNVLSFRSVDRNSSRQDIESALAKAYISVSLISDAVRDVRNLVDYISSDTGRYSDFNTNQTNLISYTNSVDNHISSLSSATNNIKNNKDSYLSSDLDIQSSLLSLEQKKNALQDAKDNLENYSVYAPFDGVISSVSAKIGDSSSASLVTIITNQKLAVISFNEVDVTKIKLGQKATLTFDALDEEVSIVGYVSEIDGAGTVSSGVVNYNVKISFEEGDQNIKTGMSVSASIITGVAMDVLMVPNSAVKTKNNNSYVEVFDTVPPPVNDGLQGVPSNVTPRQVNVNTGVSDDLNIEITLGLDGGENIVIKTISGSSKTPSTQAPSLLNAVGGNRSGGSATRAISR